MHLGGVVVVFVVDVVVALVAVAVHVRHVL